MDTRTRQLVNCKHLADKFKQSDELKQNTKHPSHPLFAQDPLTRFGFSQSWLLTFTTRPKWALKLTERVYLIVGQPSLSTNTIRVRVTCSLT